MRNMCVRVAVCALLLCSVHVTRVFGQDTARVYAPPGATLWGVWRAALCDIGLDEFAALAARAMGLPATDATYRSLPVGVWYVPACGTLAPTEDVADLRVSLEALERNVTEREHTLTLLEEDITKLSDSLQSAERTVVLLAIVCAVLAALLLALLVYGFFSFRRKDTELAAAREESAMVRTKTAHALRERGVVFYESPQSGRVTPLTTFTEDGSCYVRSPAVLERNAFAPKLENMDTHAEKEGNESLHAPPNDFDDVLREIRVRQIS